MTELRIAIISHNWFTDYAYIFEQLKRAAALYHHVVVVYGGGSYRYEVYLHDWLKGKSQFTEIIHRGNVHKYGYGGDPEQAAAILDENLHEVWKFETSPKSRRRPDHAIYPDVWYGADRYVKRRLFNAGSIRKSKWTGRVYEHEVDADGFPKPVSVRQWDAEHNGAPVVKGAVQRYANSPKGIKRRNRRRSGRGSYGDFT